MFVRCMQICMVWRYQKAFNGQNCIIILQIQAHTLYYRPHLSGIFAVLDILHANKILLVSNINETQK